MPTGLSNEFTNTEKHKLDLLRRLINLPVMKERQY
jgi:hypothetical protein